MTTDVNYIIMDTRLGVYLKRPSFNPAYPSLSTFDAGEALGFPTVEDAQRIASKCLPSDAVVAIYRRKTETTLERL